MGGGIVREKSFRPAHLCFGYPIHETIDLLSTLKAGGLAGPA